MDSVGLLELEGMMLRLKAIVVLAPLMAPIERHYKHWQVALAWQMQMAPVHPATVERHD